MRANLPRAVRGFRTALRFDRVEVLSALAFGLAAAVCRAVLTHTETRSQLLVMFAMLAAAEFGPRRRTGRRPGIRSFVINCIAVTLAVLAVKFAIEGRPHLHSTLANLHRLIG